MNSSAGTTSDDLAAFIREELPDARVVVAAEGDELPELLAEAAGDARILGIAGGDGSVRLAAGLAADKGLPLLVVPAGTFNHFATDLWDGEEGLGARSSPVRASSGISH